MNRVSKGVRRRTAASILASTLAVSSAGAIAMPGAASADTGFDLTRLAGEDRYGTAAAIARSSFTTADDVIIASGAAASFPDALTGNYAAGISAGPVLLTAADALPQVTRDALQALRARRVFIVGGTAAVSAAVEAELRRAGYTVERLSGVDRYATAAAVVERFATATSGVGSLAGARTAILASGQGFPDILAAAPLSYSNQLPLLITRPGALPSATRDLLRELKITRVIIVGGSAAVSSAVEAQLRALDGVATVTRVAGADRYSTATAVADFAVADLGYTRTHVHLARGDDFADALAGGPHSGREKAVILLTAPDSLSGVTRAWLASNSTTLAAGHIFGGVGAVSAQVQRAAQASGRGLELLVTLASSTVVAGGTITGTITGETAAVTASGCGLAAVPLGADGDASASGRQFTLPVPAELAAGPCTLTLTIVPAGGGGAVTRTIPVTVTAAPTPTPPNAPPAPTPPNAPPAPDTTGPAVTAQGTAPVEGATTVTFTADEPLRAQSVEPGDFTITGSASVQSVSVSGAAITVTTSALAVGDVVTLTAGSVTDLIGNTGPDSPVSSAAATDGTPPSVSAPSTAPSGGATTLSFFASEPLLASSLEPSDFTISGGTSQATVQSVSLNPTRRVIVVETTPLLAGNVVTLTAGSVTDPTGNAGPANAVASAATTSTTLVAEWRMEDTDRVMRDSSGRGHDGALSGNVVTGQAGPPGLGAAFGFPQTPAYVAVPDAADLDPGDEAFSVTARVRFPNPPAGADVNGLDQNTFDIVRKGLGTTPGGNFKLEILSSGVAYCLFGVPGTSYAVTGTTRLDDDQWHTITCARTADRVVLTVDGAERSVRHQLGTIANDQPFELGSRTPSGDDQYIGLLDQVEVRKG